MSELHPTNRLGGHQVFPLTNGAGGHAAEDGPGGATVGTLRQYLGVVRRNIWLVLAVTAVCAAFAAYKAYTDPPEYRSGAVVRLVDSRRTMAGGLGAMMGPTGSMGGDPIQSQIEVLKSRTVMEMVADVAGLRLQPVSSDFAAGLLQDVTVADDTPVDTVQLSFASDEVSARWKGTEVSAAYGQPLRLNGVHFAVAARPQVEQATLVVIEKKAAAGQVLAGLNASTRNNTDIVDVAYIANDPIVAQNVANAVVASFQQFNVRAAQQTAKRRRAFVYDQLSQAESSLSEAQLALTAFRERERLYSSTEKFGMKQSESVQLEVEREQLASDRRIYNSLLEDLRSARGEARQRRLQALASAPGIGDNPVVARLHSQLVEYETARDTAMTGTWGSAATNPDITRLNSLIASTETKLVNAIQMHLATLDARIAALDNLRERNRAAIQSLPATESEEVRLLARFEHFKNLVMQLREEYHRAQIDEAAQGGQVEIVDPAYQGVLVSGGKIRTVLFGLVFGLMLGCGGAVLVEGFNTSIRRREEIEKLLHIPELAIIPSIAEAPSKRKLLPFPMPVANGNGNGNGNGRHSGNGKGVKPSKELVAATDLHTPGAEAYRTLRTNILFSQSVENLRTLVVTSSAPSEGKSTTAGNLAVTFAQQGMRVLLVDCDLRKARLHKTFGVPREPGFTHFALGLKPLEEVVHATHVDGLHFLASGTLPPNPAELLGGKQMRAALDKMTQAFDCVIIDTPPLLAASDAAILGRQVDGVVLVVRAGQTERDAARQAVQKLVSVGARILGAVLNDPDSKVAKYGNHYVYEYYGETV